MVKDSPVHIDAVRKAILPIRHLISDVKVTEKEIEE
jgi:hypothetical protein